MINKSLIILLFAVIAHGSFAQTKYLNQVKYWKYRNDFKENFVYIGEGQSKSLPILYYQTELKEKRYADTGVQLGWYLAVLASEYYISSKRMYLPVSEYEMIEPSQTLIELYRALKAFERLDYEAEIVLGNDSMGQLNGFFLRDDANEVVLEKYKGKKVRSDYIKTTQEGSKSVEPSQDQYYHLLLGMALVKKFIPKGTMVKGEDLHEMANDSALRMLEYLRKNKWLIKNPCEFKPNGKNVNTHIGYNLKPLSPGIKKIYRFFDEDDERKIKTPFYANILWASMRSKLNPVYWKNDNRHMALTISTVGNGFKRNTSRKLRKVANNNEWYIYPLINSLLYPDNRDFGKSELIDRCEEIMNVLPAQGIFGTHNVFVEHEWTSSNYFLRERNFRQIGRHYTENKQFNGLDFQLFYNIWFIHRTGI